MGTKQTWADSGDKGDTGHAFLYFLNQFIFFKGQQALVGEPALILQRLDFEPANSQEAFTFLLSTDYVQGLFHVLGPQEWIKHTWFLPPGRQESLPQLLAVDTQSGQQPPYVSIIIGQCSDTLDVVYSYSIIDCRDRCTQNARKCVHVHYPSHPGSFLPTLTYHTLKGTKTTWNIFIRKQPESWNHVIRWSSITLRKQTCLVLCAKVNEREFCIQDSETQSFLLFILTMTFFCF